MQEIIGKCAVPAIWLGILSFLLGVVAHFGRNYVLTLTADAYLEITQACFLFAIAAALATKRS